MAQPWNPWLILNNSRPYASRIFNGEFLATKNSSGSFRNQFSSWEIVGFIKIENYSPFLTVHILCSIIELWFELTCNLGLNSKFSLVHVSSCVHLHARHEFVCCGFQFSIITSLVSILCNMSTFLNAAHFLDCSKIFIFAIIGKVKLIQILKYMWIFSAVHFWCTWKDNIGSAHWSKR